MCKRFRWLTRTAQIFMILAGTMSVVLGSSCSSRGYSGPVESVTVGWSPFEQEALLWTAEDQDFFRQNGLNVTMRKYDTGVGSLDGMLNGEVDIAVGVTGFATVGRTFQKPGVRIIASAARVEQQYLVGRKDRGIEQVSDLKGKRIGTTFGTVAEFYLGRFLELNGLSTKDVTVVDLRTPAEWENAVADGVVDAIVTAQPYADLARQRLGDNAVLWPVQGGQPIFGLVVTSDDWVAKHRGPVDRFLKSLAQAEEFASRNPGKAKAIVQRRLGVDTPFVESVWARDHFALSLDPSLIAAMEDQARWLIKNNLTTQKQVPDFLNYIYEDPLKAVEPGAVRIIR